MQTLRVALLWLDGINRNYGAALEEEGEGMLNCRGSHCRPDHCNYPTQWRGRERA